MVSLPPLPDAVAIGLTNEDSLRLRSLDYGVWANPETSCLTCAKQGVFLTRDGDSTVVVECNCTDQWLLHRFLLNAGIGLAYQRLGWSDVSRQVPKDVRQAVKEYLDNLASYTNAGIGMILWGSAGTGKTLLAVLLLKEMLALGVDGYFTQFNEMIDAYTSGWRNEDEARWFIRRVRNAGVLVIDDVGKESKNRSSELVGSLFDQVIRARVANSKPTIITTNDDPTQVSQRYGMYVISLLAESSLSLEVTGLDYRDTMKEQKVRDAQEGVVRPISVPV